MQHQPQLHCKQQPKRLSLHTPLLLILMLFFFLCLLLNHLNVISDSTVYNNPIISECQTLIKFSFASSFMYNLPSSQLIWHGLWLLEDHYLKPTTLYRGPRLRTADYNHHCNVSGVMRKELHHSYVKMLFTYQNLG